MTAPLRMGRISYLNVLPIYHPLEAGWIKHNFRFIQGPPAELNALIRADGLDLGSCSSIEYARNPDRYFLLPDLAIASQGPVKSVLLLSRIPPQELTGQELLVTAESNTSAALLRIVLETVYQVRPVFTLAKGSVSQALAQGANQPAALAIGDEALALRHDPAFPFQLDLGEVWRDWTGLPFVFGVWVARRKAFAERPDEVREGALLLRESKHMGVAAIEEVVDITCRAKPNVSREELRRYYDHLCYDLGDREQQGLSRFFGYLAEHGIIEKAPELAILD